MAEIDWYYNESTQRWEGEAHGCNMHVVIDFHQEYAVFLASVHLEDGEHAIHYAPQAFHERQEAQQWCEQTAYECAHPGETSGFAVGG